MKGEALIALPAYPRPQQLCNNLDINKTHILKTCFFPVTSQGLGKVSVGEQTHTEDILVPKS